MNGRVVTRVGKQGRFDSFGRFGWPAAIFLFACLIRIPFLAHGPGGWDDIDFALALKNYDVAQMQPHFPGYPVYVLAAFGVSAWVSDPFLALSWLSMLAAACSVFPLYYIVEKVSGKRLAIWVTLLWSTAPLSLVLGTQPLSDSFGTLIALCVAASSLIVLQQQRTQRARALALLASGLLLGLLYGVRLSYLPFAAVPLWAGYVYLRDTGNWSDVLRAAAGAVLISAAWVIALAGNVGGFDTLWMLATSFTAGHFSDWGGTFHEGASLLDRLTYWLGRQLMAAGAGTPWPGQSPVSYLVLVLVLLALTGLIRVLFEKGRGENRPTGEESATWREWGLIAAWVIPYLLWTFFAQNIEKPRHLLPLLPPMLWMFAAGLTVWRRMAGPMLISLCAAMLLVGISQIEGQSITPSPMVQLSSYLESHQTGESSIIFTYEEERVIRYQHPWINTMRLRKFSDFQISLLTYPVLPKHIYLTDSVLRGFQLPNAQEYVREVARFSGSEWLYPTYHEIVLYEVLPEKAGQLLHLSQLPKGNN